MLHLYLRFTISEWKKNNGLIIIKITAVKLLFNHKNSHLDDFKDKRNYNFPYSRSSSQFLFTNNRIWTIWLLHMSSYALSQVTLDPGYWSLLGVNMIFISLPC